MLEENVVLSARNISKKYYINKSKTSGKKKDQSAFWALSDVSFDVRKGQILGIIGQNGSGKSTILKILAEIISPTSGHVEYNGSMLSILDIGTGFHPDLSGYENIFFNASLLGIKHNSIKKLAEDIIDFSEIREFIHQPVKNYSNGMYLRLALSIALFAENEIILLDEVMSVGDEEFRYKAVKKIRAQADKGKTCIMVSHDLDSVLDLCDDCVLMEKGKVIYAGQSKHVVEDYFMNIYRNLAQSSKPVTDHPNCSFISAVFDKTDYCTNEPIVLTIMYKTNLTDQLNTIVMLRNYFSAVMRDSATFRPDYVMKKVIPGVYATQCVIPADLLSAGNYMVDIFIGDPNTVFLDIPYAAKFTIRLMDWEADKNWNQTREIIPLRAKCEWLTMPAE